MFQHFNDLYLANVRMTGKMPEPQKLIDGKLDRYMAEHWDWPIVAKVIIQQDGLFYLDFEVKRAYDNQKKFAEWIANGFIPEVKEFLAYLCANHFSSPEIEWDPNWHFSVNNAQKQHNLNGMNLQQQLSQEFSVFYTPPGSQDYMIKGTPMKSEIPQFNHANPDTPWTNGNGR